MTKGEVAAFATAFEATAVTWLGVAPFACREAPKFGNLNEVSGNFVAECET